MPGPVRVGKFLIFMCAFLLLQSCDQDLAKRESPDIPGRDAADMILKLHSFFIDRPPFGPNWATPRFPVDKWCASYQGEGIWLVQVYDIDGTFAGTWSVPEMEAKQMVDFAVEQLLAGRWSSGQTLKEIDSALVRFQSSVEPYDEKARSGSKGRMPRLPTFLSEFGEDRKEQLVQAVQTHIVQLRRQQVTDDISVAEIQKLVRSHYPLDWHASYDSSYWVVAAAYGEYKVEAVIESGGATVKYLLGEYGWQENLFRKPRPGKNCPRE